MEATEMLDRLFVETQTLVNENWPAITRVANALVKRDFLTESEVDILMRPS